MKKNNEILQKRGLLSTPLEHRTNSVSNPSAQSVTLLQPTAHEIQTYNTLIDIAKNGLTRFGHYAIGVDLMLSGGLRVSELIDPKMLFVNKTGQIYIQGKKGSANKLVSSLYQREYWSKLSGWVANPCAIVSRFSWYRFLKSQGVYLEEKGKINMSVTHVPRKLKAFELFEGGFGVEQVAEVVGHKNVNSTNYYKPTRYRSREGV